MKRCGQCSSINREVLFGVDGAQIVQCNSCGLVRTDGGGGVSYDEYHRDFDYEKYEKYFRNIFELRYIYIAKYVDKSRKILDVGASTGLLLQIFQEKGWDVTGVEPSKESCKLAKKRGVKMINSVFEDAKLPSNHFDVVVVNHTLEHIQDPVQFLKIARRVLKKGGVLYVDVPNYGSLSSKFWGKRWKFLMPKEHLWHFTPRTLFALLEKVGLEVVWSTTKSGVFDNAHPVRYLTNSFLDRRKAFITDTLRIPLDVIEKACNRGTSVAVIGKKK